MTDTDLRYAMECVRVHRGAVAMMKGERFHMAVIGKSGDIIGTVKCDKKGSSNFYAVRV